MKVFKRNQLVILVISLMLITAGYLNFTTGNNTIVETGTNIADIGDATLVSIAPENSENSSEEDVTKDISEENNVETNTQEDSQNNNESKTTLAVVDDQYFTKSKLERDTMYSQMLETYQEIYNNTASTAEQKTEAMREISKISNTRNGIMIAENLVIAKGFEDLVIFVNTNSTSVIIKAQELGPDQIAQIQNIISRELSVSIETIHISTK